MSNSIKSELIRYITAVAAVLVAILLNFIMWEWATNRVPYAVFFAAVSFVSWFGGVGPGLLSVLLSTLLGHYYFIEPYYEFGLEPSELISTTLYFGVSVFISLLQSRLKSARDVNAITLQSIGDAVIITDSSGCIEKMNFVAEQLTGWTTAEVRGKDLAEVFRIINQESRETVENPVKKVLKDGNVVGLANHTLLITREGKEIPIDDSGAPIKDEKGRVYGVVLVFRDVSEKKESQRKLLERDKQYKILTETASDSIISIDENSRIVFANRTTEKLFGYKVEELIGESLTRLMPDYLRHIHENAVKRYVETGQRHISWAAAELPGLHKNGKEIPLEISFGEHKRDGKHIFTGIIRDISERKRVESALREKEDLFRMMANTAPVMIWIADTEGHCTFFNKSWLDFTGKSLEDSLGDRWAESVHQEDVEKTLILYRSSVEERTPFTMEYRFRRHDGEYRWVLECGVPTFDTQGGFTGFIGSAIDITDRKKAEEEKEESLQRERAARTAAENANRLKDQFLATVSHELRTPLTAMFGWARMLRSGKLDEPTFKKAIETIERNAETQTRLIEDLLDVSRIITGKLRLDVRPLDPVPVIQAAIDSIRPAAESRNIHIRSVLNPDAGPILADIARLQQIVWNLLSNAVKFTPKGGRIEVVLLKVGSNLKISVSDTGIGIRPEFLPFVFDRFRQQDSTDTRKFGGLGLGLSIVRHLAELHGGSVDVNSDGDNKGATFTVSLPLLAIKSNIEERKFNYPEVTRESVIDCPPSLENLKILVVDDEADTRDLLSTILEDCRAEVLTCASPTEALPNLDSFNPDVIISDIEMPGTSGYEFIRSVREQEKRTSRWTPAIALTAYGRSEDRMRALSAGFQMHIPKPVEPAELLIVISNLATQKQNPELQPDQT
jgi:PAS domain S-box-containing protein